jgi:hypothetical protein
MAVSGIGERLLLAPVSAEEMRTASVLSAMVMAVLVGRRFFGRYARPVLIGATVLYIGAIVALLLYHALSG